MLEFKKPELSDIKWVKECYDKTRIVDCEYCFGNLFVWSDIYKTEICNFKDFFVSRTPDEKGYSFCFPKGSGDYDEILSLIENEYDDFSFFGLNHADREILQKIRGDKYIVSSNRDLFDYFYKVSDLSELKGRKYHQKRNHISYFEKNYNWKYEKIDSGNIDDCLKMNEKWQTLNSDKVGTGIHLEETAIKRAFDNYSQLGFVGGLIRVDGEVVAFTLGEEMTQDCFCVHFEKAYADMRGAYAILNREFVRNELQDYYFVNREEDMGIEGLRKAKMSYHPCMISEIFDAEKR